MDTTTLAIGIMCIFLIFGQASIGGGAGKVDEKQFARYVSRSGLRLDPRLREPVVDRLVHQDRWMVGGGVIGLVLAWSTATAAGSQQTPAIMWLASAGGCGVGAGLGVLWQRSRLRPGDSRVARTRSTSLADYLTRGGLQSTRRAAVLTLVVAGLMTGATWMLRLLEGSGWSITAMWIPVGLALLGLGGFGLFSRMIVDRPQPVASDGELAWDDLVKARGIRGLMSTSLVLSFSSIVWSMITLGNLVIAPEPRAGQEQLTLWLGVGALLVGAVAVVVALVPLLRAWPRSRFHVLERLWVKSPVAPR